MKQIYSNKGQIFIWIIIVLIIVLLVGGSLYFYLSLQQKKVPKANQQASVEKSAQEQECLNSGGTVTIASCCKSSGDFPNSCLIGACGCSSTDSHQVKVCDCGVNKCFDGNKCTAKEKPASTLTPQEVIKAWFEDQKKGDWQSVFTDMVDVDGKPYSQKCQDGFKKAFGANVGADYTLNIKNDLKTGGCKDSPELNQLAKVFGFQLPDGQCAIVSISYSTKSSGSVDTFSTLFKINNDWKVMMYCAPLLITH